MQGLFKKEDDSFKEEDYSGSDKYGSSSVSSGGVKGNIPNPELEDIKSRLNSVITWINQFYDAFSELSSTVKEIQQKAYHEDKKISESVRELERASKVFEDIKPDKLVLEHQEIKKRTSEIEESIAYNRRIMEEIRENLNKEQTETPAVISDEEIDLKKFGDYQAKFYDLLKVIDKLSMEVIEIKKAVNIYGRKG